MDMQGQVGRRTFLAGGLAAAAAGVSFRGWCAAHGADHDFASAAAACGWDASAPDAFYFLHATDLHMTENPDWDRGALQMKDKFMGRCFIDEINAMNALPVRPAALVLTGDLTSHVTMNPATWPRAERKWAHFRKYVTDRLQVPVHQLIGNNDCAAAPYRTVFPECPLHWTLTRGGITFAGLHGYNRWKPENTNHAGILYDEEQLAWLRGVVAASTARTLVLFTHEPLKDDDSHCARRQLAPILDRFRGEEVWNVCGHNHANHTCTIRIGHRSVRSAETLTPVGSGFVVGDGGYRVVYCREGRICGSAVRWLTPNGEPIGYAPDPATRASKPMRLLEESWPAEARATALVGSAPLDIAGSVRIEDRISDYYICRPDRKGAFGRLVWKAPRTVKGAKVAKALVRCGQIEGHAGVSADGRNWIETPVAWARGSAPKEIAVPADLAGETLWFSLSNESKYECKFFGYALM